MSSKAPAIIVSVSMLVLLGGVVAYAVVHSDSKQQTYAPIPQSIASTDALTQQSTGATLGADTGQGGVNLQSNLGGAGGSSSGSSAAKSPGPAEFGQYDQYKDGQHALFGELVVGTGLEVTSTTKVAVTYQGWLTNGTLFDASKTDDKGQLQPFIFQEGAHSVIPGFEEAILGMKVGGKRRFIIPPAVGYGAEGHDPVPPNAVLVFDVTLVTAL